MKNYTNLSKNNKNYSIIGLDVGNATLTSNTGIILDAKITTVEPFTTSNKMVIEGKTYFLGNGNYDTTYKKVNKKHYIEMMYGLLALSTNSTHNCICLGLPLSQYKADRTELINLIMKNNNKTVRINEFIEKTLIIEDVEVFPEAVATLNDDYEGIVIDLGGGTTDCALVVNEEDKRKVVKHISIPKGTIKLYTDMANVLNNKYGLELTLEDSKRIIKRGFLPLDGERADIKIALDIYEEYLSDLISQLQSNFSLRTEIISLTGGGATIIYEELKNRLGEGVSIQKNSIFANANAFYDLGISVFGEE